MPSILSRPDAARQQAGVESYHEHGFLVMRGLFTAADLAPVRAEAEQLVQRHDLIATENLRCRWQPHTESGACLFETFDPIIDIAPACGQPGATADF